jgi:hypothetical protein
MANKFWVTLLIVLIPAMLITGCTNSNVVKASLNQEFTLAIGQTAKISLENLEIKLTDVANDSRCPQRVTCIWAGQVSCVLESTLNGKTESYTLVVPGAGDTSGQVYGNYKLKANVEPYPKQGISIIETDYRMTLTVSRNP